MKNTSKNVKEGVEKNSLALRIILIALQNPSLFAWKVSSIFPVVEPLAAVKQGKTTIYEANPSVGSLGTTQ